MKIIINLYLLNNRYLFLLLIIINLFGCNKNIGNRQYHRVKQGETLYSISKKYNIKMEHLALRNRLKVPSTINKGQKLIISPNNINNKTIVVNDKKNIIYNKKQSNLVKKSVIINNKTQDNFINNNSIKRISWGWPAKGNIIKTFIISGPNKVNGIDIAGKKGDLVLSAANGKVVYSGNNLRGYGNLIIIKHNEDFLTAYAHNDKILVKEQQIVTKGQKIAIMGNTDSNRVKLHFEVRYKGKPIDPLKVLGRGKANC